MGIKIGRFKLYPFIDADCPTDPKKTVIPNQSQLVKTLYNRLPPQYKPEYGTTEVYITGYPINVLEGIIHEMEVEFGWTVRLSMTSVADTVQPLPQPVRKR